MENFTKEELWYMMHLAFEKGNSIAAAACGEPADYEPPEDKDVLFYLEVATKLYELWKAKQ